MFSKEPQLQFIDRVVDIPVLRAETCTHSANCAEDCRDSTGAVLGEDLVDPVSSGKYNGTFVFTAPVAEPTVMSFTVPLNG